MAVTQFPWKRIGHWIREKLSDVKTLILILLVTFVAFAFLTKALKVGLPPFLDAFIKQYRTALGLLVDWIGINAVFEFVISSFNHWLNLNLKLFDHWKEVFTLLFMYFSHWINLPIRKREWADAAFVFFTATVLVFVTCLAVGLVPLDGKLETANDSLLIVVPMAVAIGIFDGARRTFYARLKVRLKPLETLRGIAERAMRQSSVYISLSVGLILALIHFDIDFRGRGIAVVTMSILSLALFWVCRSGLLTFEPKEPEVGVLSWLYGWWLRCKQRQETSYALQIVLTLGGAILAALWFIARSIVFEG